MSRYDWFALLLLILLIAICGIGKIACSAGKKFDVAVNATSPQ